MELAGRSALLTGATGGLGRAIAAALAGRGAELILSGRKAEALEALASELPGDGHRTLPADLAEPGAAEKLAAEAGDVDILVANAGLPGTGRLTDFTTEQLTGALRVNLEAPMLLARALEPAMLERGSGHMVFVSSLSGKSATPLSSIYNATKFGLRGFALGLRADLDPLGIGVSIVSPGTIREAGMYADSGAPPTPRPRHRHPAAGRRGRPARDRAQQGRDHRRSDPATPARPLRPRQPRRLGQDRQRRRRPKGGGYGRQRPIRQALTQERRGRRWLPRTFCAGGAWRLRRQPTHSPSTSCE